jgi:Family of unknown function (DUF6328)
MATELKDRIKVGLDEDRMIVLVVQVLLGFGFRGVFEPGFERLPSFGQSAKLVSSGLLMLTLALLLAVPAYHRIAEAGENTSSVEGVMRCLIAGALLPFAVGLGIDVGMATLTVFGTAAGVIAALAASVLALFFWYALGYFRAAANESKPGENMDEQTEPTPLKEKIKQALTECRIVLPGTQAFLGFQLSAFLTDGFSKLPRTDQLLHLAALTLVALSGILLMTPAAYHRIGEKGNMTERFLRLCGTLLVCAMLPLALGITLDFYVVVSKVTHAPLLSASLSAAAFLVFIACWFAFPYYGRKRQHRIITTGAARISGRVSTIAA